MFRLNKGFSAVALVLLSNSVAAAISFEDVTFKAGFSGGRSESWGASWGDLDGDGYPDVFANNHRNRAELFRNNADGTFKDVSREVDLSRSPGWTGGRADVDTHGSAWGDIDRDGDDDIYQSVSSSMDRLYINDGGLFTDKSSAYKLDSMTQRADRMTLLFDYNGDGRLDVMAVALRYSGLYPQQSNGTFDGYKKVSLGCADNTFAHLADVDPSKPGLELLCGPRNGSYPTNIYAFSSGSIKDVSSLVIKTPKVNDAITADFNGDLRPDIFEVIGSRTVSDAIQVNSNRIETVMYTSASAKITSFKTTGKLALSVDMLAGVPVHGDPAYIDIGATGYSPTSLQFTLDPADSKNWGIRYDSLGMNIGYDNTLGVWSIYQNQTPRGNNNFSYVGVDSDQPITDLNFQGKTGADKPAQNVLLMSSPNGYVNTTVASGLGAKTLCSGAAAGDFDNDMDEDLVLSCTAGSYNIPNILYENLGDGTFKIVPDAGGAAGQVGAAFGDSAGTSENVTLVDYDVDGFLDVFVTNGNNLRPEGYGGPSQLFRNKGNANNWVELDLEGVASNRDGIGAQVYVMAGGKTQYRERNGGYHRWSQNYKRIHVGLAANSQVDIKVVWPNGSTDNYTNVTANAIYKATQGGNIVRGFDTDGDKVTKVTEAAQGTNPNDPLSYRDTDRDGVPDAVEIIEGTDPNNYASKRDTDNGGIPDYVETVLSPNAGQGAFDLNNAADDTTMDIDGDGLANVHEMVLGINQNMADTDNGGIDDGAELVSGLDPLNPVDDVGTKDSDSDGLNDWQEIQLGTDPTNPDTDGDGLGDAQEVQLGTDPKNPDTDGEGLSDGDEVSIYGTDPLQKNTDKDGLTDKVEVLFKHTDPLNPDTDGDGLKDGAEAGASGLGTDPLKLDTDGDGVNDGTEVGNGTDPLNSASY